jgi:ketosteroid isomerase-like protein
MAEENVETVRRIYADWERGSIGAGVELFDPEIRFETFMPDSNDRIAAEGPDGIESFMREFLTNWRDYRLIGDEFEAIADDIVFVTGRQAATGRSSGIEVETELCSAWRFRDGRVVQLVFEREREAALAAVQEDGEAPGLTRRPQSG